MMGALDNGDKLGVNTAGAMTRIGSGLAALDKKRKDILPQFARNSPSLASPRVDLKAENVIVSGLERFGFDSKKNGQTNRAKKIA